MSADWIDASKRLPPEHKTVLVWVRDKFLPFCGYIRIHSSGPFWVVYHGNSEISTDVLFWCDCLPLNGPPGFVGQVYDSGQLGAGKRSKPPTEQERNRRQQEAPCPP